MSLAFTAGSFSPMIGYGQENFFVPSLFRAGLMGQRAILHEFKLFVISKLFELQGCAIVHIVDCFLVFKMSPYCLKCLMTQIIGDSFLLSKITLASQSFHDPRPFDKDGSEGNV